MVQVKSKLLFGLVDSEGKWIVEPKFDEMLGLDRETGAVLVKLDNKWGYLHQDGSFLVEPKFEAVLLGFRNGVAVVQYDGANRKINTKGEFLD
jgi:hypothetical protein